jgi:hypothetical protein
VSEYRVISSGYPKIAFHLKTPASSSKTIIVTRSKPKREETDDNIMLHRLSRLLSDTMEEDIVRRSSSRYVLCFVLSDKRSK